MIRFRLFFFVQIAEYQIQQTDQNIDAPVKELPKDTVSLSELTLYSFDSISDNGPKKVSYSHVIHSCYLLNMGLYFSFQNSDILVSGQDFETDMSSSDNVAPASVKEDINIVKEMINQIESKNGNKKAAKEKTVKVCIKVIIKKTDFPKFCFHVMTHNI